MLSANESGDFRRRANSVEYVVRDVSLIVAINFDQHVTRIEHPRRFDALVAAHLDHSFGRHQHLTNRAFERRARNASFQAFANLLLVSRISMKNKPLLHKYCFSLPASRAGDRLEMPIRDRLQTD